MKQCLHMIQLSSAEQNSVNFYSDILNEDSTEDGRYECMLLKLPIPDRVNEVIRKTIKDAIYFTRFPRPREPLELSSDDSDAEFINPLSKQLVTAFIQPKLEQCNFFVFLVHYFYF